MNENIFKADEVKREKLFLEDDDGCSDCFNMSCNLITDPLCNLKWLHNESTNKVTFQIKFKSFSTPKWIAIGFNPNLSPSMVLFLFFFTPYFTLFVIFVKFLDRHECNYVDIWK